MASQPSQPTDTASQPLQPTGITIGKAPLQPAPHIPLRNARGEIDVSQLGDKDPLNCVIEDADVKGGQPLYPVWRGLAADGTPFDYVSGFVEVPIDYEQTRRMCFSIENRYVTPYAGGWAFLSYKVGSPAEAIPDSRRIFCYIGLRDHDTEAEALPVAQVPLSHARVIVFSTIGSDGVNVWASPYRAMQVGDTVELTMRKFDNAGGEVDPVRVVHEVTEANNHEPLQWPFSKSQFIRILGGRVEFQYRITLAAGGTQVESPVQTMEVLDDPSPTERLPAPCADDVADRPVDPSDFLEGVVLRVPVYPDIQAGDHLLVSWQRPDQSEPHVQFARMDASSLKSKETVFRIDASMLVLGEHEIVYQYARTGVELTSHPLRIEFETPRVLPAPTITKARADAITGTQVLRADDAPLGAYVEVPDVSLRDGEYFEVHWDGYIHNGKQITHTPVETGGRKFKIDPGVVAANMHPLYENNSRRFNVFYVIVDKDGKRSAPSQMVDLRVHPATLNTNITCLEARSNGELWASDLERLQAARLQVSGARLWTFAAPGQLFRLAIEEGPVLRDGQPVSENENNRGLIEVLLRKAVYDTLPDNQQFTVMGTVSFDEGDSWHPLQPLRLTPKKSR